MDMDWKKEASSQGELYPDNTYRVNLDRWEKVTAGTGTLQIRWYAKIVGGPYDGKSVIEHIPLSEAALWKLASFVKAVGVPIEQLPKMTVGSEVFNRILDVCKGRHMYWQVYVAVYNGKKNNRVSDYLLAEEQDPVEIAEIDDVPDFVKNKEVPF